MPSPARPPVEAPPRALQDDPPRRREPPLPGRLRRRLLMSADAGARSLEGMRGASDRRQVAAAERVADLAQRCIARVDEQLHELSGEIVVAVGQRDECLPVNRCVARRVGRRIANRPRGRLRRRFGVLVPGSGLRCAPNACRYFRRGDLDPVVSSGSHPCRL